MIKKTYIIAEVGPNHQGSLKLAFKYVKKLSKIGVDAIKFQIGIAEEHYSKDSFKPNYHKKNFKNNKEIISQAKKRLLQLDDHIKIYRECKKYKIDYICSAFDLISLKFLHKYWSNGPLPVKNPTKPSTIKKSAESIIQKLNF